MSAYRKIAEYDFNVLGEMFSITEIGSAYVVVEEARKNGQEDCHDGGVLVFDGSSLRWDEGEKTFIRQYSREIADAICEYLNSSGLPPEDE